MTAALDDLPARIWDALVIGAGPAGSMAARALARDGASVLLVDRARFPRDKPCGCCLNGHGLQALERAGLGHLTRDLGALPLREMLLAAGRRRARLPLPAGVALSRRALDAALVQAARDAGARVATGLAARWLPCALDDPARAVRLDGHGASRTVQARVVVAAGGLGQPLPGAVSRPAPRSRVGAWTTLPAELPAELPAGLPAGAEAAGTLPAGRVLMAAGRDGYVGLVLLEDGRVDVAAALDPGCVSRDGAATLVGAIVAGSALPGAPVWSSRLAASRWRLTPPLTRRVPAPEAHRLVVVGDAAGYVEPFTGEGLGWALRSGLEIVPRVAAAARGERLVGVRRRLAARQRACRGVAGVLRRPRLAALLVAALSVSPRLAAPLVRMITTP